MTRPLVIALLMSGCVFGAETDTVVLESIQVRVNEVRAETNEGMQPLRSAVFVPDFGTGAELSFDAEGWTGTIDFEDLVAMIENGGGETILIERDGSAEVQPIRITSEVIPFRVDGFQQRATLTFVTYIDNRSVQLAVELAFTGGC